MKISFFSEPKSPIPGQGVAKRSTKVLSESLKKSSHPSIFTFLRMLEQTPRGFYGTLMAESPAQLFSKSVEWKLPYENFIFFSEPKSPIPGQGVAKRSIKVLSESLKKSSYPSIFTFFENVGTIPAGLLWYIDGRITCATFFKIDRMEVAI